MGIKLKVDLGGFNKRFSNQRLIAARKAAANEAHQAMDKYVPIKKGNLRGKSYVSSDGSHIVYEMPYAKAQFYGIVHGSPVRHYSKHPPDQPSKRWDLRLKGNRSDMAKVKDSFVKELNRGN